MKLGFRWYGESDHVSLDSIRQIPNMRSVVSAVYDVPPGEIWSLESIERVKLACEKAGLVFDVVESIPVHEEIKLGGKNASKLIDNYKENIRRVAKFGIKCVTYNFMPVFDWTRTSLDHRHPDGSTSLVLYPDELAGLDPQHDDISLPGWDASYSQSEVRRLLDAYGELGESGLWQNLERFLREIVPVAEECGVRLAIHPDDPPYSIFGLPRIVRDEAALDRLLGVVDSPANSLCLCTGSLGCVPTNNVPKLAEKYAKRDRIAFVHLRNVQILPNGGFEERAHLSEAGSLDMFAIVKALADNGFDGYVRPDHGRMIWGETGRAGYGLFDRALGAAYINGLFEACEKMH